MTIRSNRTHSEGITDARFDVGCINRCCGGGRWERLALVGKCHRIVRHLDHAHAGGVVDADDFTDGDDVDIIKMVVIEHFGIHLRTHATQRGRRVRRRHNVAGAAQRHEDARHGHGHG